MKTIFFDLDGTLTELKESPKLRLLIGADIIERLSSQYQLGLITASKTEETLFALRILGIQKYFQPALIFTADTCPYPKKNGRPFILAKQRASEVVAMIGDSESDRIGSKKANIPFIFANNFSPRLFLE